jgi:hypothetical protein
MGCQREVIVLKRTQKRQDQSQQKLNLEGAIEQQFAPPSTIYSPQWIVSSKQLDLLLLAVCSCLLTLLCHPALLQQSAASASSSAVQSSVPSTTSQINFYVKSALMSSFQDKEREGISEAG